MLIFLRYFDYCIGIIVGYWLVKLYMLLFVDLSLCFLCSIIIVELCVAQTISAL